MSMPSQIYPSAREAIGNTPLTDLAKLEYLNPGYSKKDRIARQIIADAQAAGQIDVLCDFAGFSSGANVAAVMQLIQTAFKGRAAVVLLCDSELKYLRTDLWL